MKKAKIIGVLICTLLVIAILPTMSSMTDDEKIYKTPVSQQFETETDWRDVNENSVNWPPIWNVDDYWIYDIELSTYVEEWIPITIEGSIDDFTLHVGDDSHEMYTLDFEGKLNGCVEAIIKIDGIPFKLTLSGWLKRTTVDGSVSLTKNGFGVKEIHIHLHGKARLFFRPIPLFIPVPFDITTTVIFESPITLLGFTQLDVGEYWIIPVSSFTISTRISPFFGIFGKSFNFEDLSPPDWVDIYTECMSKESVTVPAGTFEAYKVWIEDGGIVEYYYAPEANNIIKIQTNEELDYFRFCSELKSTNYE